MYRRQPFAGGGRIGCFPRGDGQTFKALAVGFFTFKPCGFAPLIAGLPLLRHCLP